jgi:pimeloyl-ACP methyl ester carboxylesterase
LKNKVRSFIDIDGISLECLNLQFDGAEAKPTLVFLHEGLGCIELWRDFPENLCAALDLNGFIYSRQGYGASDPIPLPRPLDFMHQEAMNVTSPVLSAARINSAILIGHSDGGSISLIHAGAIKDPRVKAITTIAAHVFNEELTVKSIQESKKAYETENLRERLKKYHGSNVDCAFWGWNDTWLNPDFWNWNLEEFLPSIGVPTLIMQGADDQYGTNEQITAIEKGLICLNQTVIIPGAKHSPHLEQQDITINKIQTFINQHIAPDYLA